MKRKKFIQEDLDNSDVYNFERGISSKDSKEEHSQYSDHIYVAESESKELLFDRNNPVVKLILWILGLIAIVGTVYYVLTGLGVI